MADTIEMDDLLKILRADDGDWRTDQAADLIEALAAKLAKVEADADMWQQRALHINEVAGVQIARAEAAEAKLAEVEEMKRLLAMDKINLRGELAGVQGKLAAANDQLDSARHSVTVMEGRADHFKDRAEAAEQRVATLEAALPAVYRLALGDAAERLLAAVTREYKDHRDYRNAIRALLTPTADELMARIQTGETDE